MGSRSHADDGSDRRRLLPGGRYATLSLSFSDGLTGNDVAVGRRSRQHTRLLWIRILASCIQNGCGGAGGQHCRYSATAVTQTDLARRITACDFCQIAQGKTAMEAKLKQTKEKERRSEQKEQDMQIRLVSK